MPFGKICDTLWHHPKWRSASKNARSLWTTAHSHCDANLTDGLVLATSLPMLDGTEEEAAALVQAKLWDPVADGNGVLVGWQFHDWLDYNPSRAEVLADRKLRAAARALPGLRREVRGRDGSTCRYCGRRVVWSDRRSGIGGTYDVVDPAEDVTADNLVVSCRRCAGQKAGRDVDAAGMRLGPAESPATGRPGQSSGMVRPFSPRSETVPEANPGRSETVSGSSPGRSEIVPESDLGMHQPPYPAPSPLRGGDGAGGVPPRARRPRAVRTATAPQPPAFTAADAPPRPRPDVTARGGAQALDELRRAQARRDEQAQERHAAERTARERQRHAAEELRAREQLRLAEFAARAPAPATPEPPGELATPAIAPQLTVVPPPRRHGRVRRRDAPDVPWSQLALRLLLAVPDATNTVSTTVTTERRPARRALTATA
ncbi:hypothetical protein [Frankia sp. AgB1.8]|uniref:hypothetical protein n=2 Tax=unclassified Frankia TaxID=2632575 RepID=UPI0019312851|nr:hypothetical protein [Frankia sp. AgB1.8]MBL7622394.1 hypothetical protein [Frankia sp. AgB1.8]